ncbi:MAG: tail fiber domain-containing protein [Syntrophales bacterium]|nr:tail fiber domain-containing protein [Syntrophales bacterium]
MIRWLKKLFGKPEDPRDASLRQLMDSIPDELIRQLAADLAAAERDKARTQGYLLGDSEQAKLEKEIEYRLRNPGKHKGQIPVRVETLYKDLSYRNSRNHSSSSSSPISDIRVKANVRLLSHALETALALRGVEFEWRYDEYPELGLNLYPEVGLVAQEVEAVLPTVVGENEEGFKTVNYACLVPVLIEAIKEQQLTINKLQDRVHVLEAKPH